MKFSGESFENPKNNAEVLPAEMQAVADEIESILKEELEVDEGYMYSFDGLEKTVSFPIPEQYAAHMDVVMTRLETSTYSEDYVFSLAASEDETLLVMTTK